MRLLAIDTALGACQAAVVDGDRVLAVRSEFMQRGHQERLGPLVQEIMSEAGLGFGDLDRIGVTAGPGSFTGLRVGLAFAKGLALARGIPCVGVGSLDALAASVPPPAPAVAAAIDGRRGQVYLRLFPAGGSPGEAEALELEDAARRLAAFAAPGGLVLVGSGAPLIAAARPEAAVLPLEAPDPLAVARLAARAPGDAGPPRPIYLRAPDARLPA